MTLYGDLDVSVIDEMPPGRKRILTKHYTADQIEQAYSAIRREVDAGRQAYVVYPVIEESETQAMKAAQQMYEHLSKEVFPDVPVGLLHGRLGSGEKESAQRFWSRPRSLRSASTCRTRP
jgi:ATP-dependent DNA helicase RecG